MKYCPYCGAVLPDGAPSFCPECGESLLDGKSRVVEKEDPHKKKQKPEKVKKAKEKRKKPMEPLDDPILADDYDGYYDDRVPIDEGHRRDGIDKGVVKKVVALVIVLLVVIAACITLLYVM